MRSGTCFFPLSSTAPAPPLTKSYAEIITYFQPRVYRKFNKCCLNLPPAGRRGCRTAPPADWTPWRPCAPRPAPPRRRPSAFPGPFPPCPRRRRQSSCAHR